jgi:hypothetical protein
MSFNLGVLKLVHVPSGLAHSNLDNSTSVPEALKKYFRMLETSLRRLRAHRCCTEILV